MGLDPLPTPPLEPRMSFTINQLVVCLLRKPFITLSSLYCFESKTFLLTWNQTDSGSYMSTRIIKFIKGIYLSKALTCMKFFLYKQKFLFYQGDGYLRPHCCMNNLYISYRPLPPKIQLLSNQQHAYQSF